MVLVVLVAALLVWMCGWRWRTDPPGVQNLKSLPSKFRHNSSPAIFSHSYFIAKTAQVVLRPSVSHSKKALAPAHRRRRLCRTIRGPRVILEETTDHISDVPNGYQPTVVRFDIIAAQKLWSELRLRRNKMD